MSPGRSTRYSAPGMKKECPTDMCVRFSSSEEKVRVQKRQLFGERRARAAAIFSSMVFITSSSSASSSTTSELDVFDSVFAFTSLGGATEGTVAVCDASGADSTVSETGAAGGGREAALSSFSLCFFDWICDLYAFSVV